MGISPSLSRAILQEHTYKPITGQIVLIGRQSMGMTPEQARQMCAEQGVTPRKGLPSDQMLDTTTRAGEATRTAFPLWRFASRDIVLTYVVAEKGADTTWNKKPVQAQYRPSDEPYAAAFAAWQRSSRPKLTSAKRFMLPRHVNRLLPRSMRTAPEVKGFDYIGQI